jgi:poly(A) polymerase
MTEIEILKFIGHIADQHNICIYAVGGFVRDRLLEKQVKDIDFVVLGDGPQFAEQIAKALNSRNLVIFEKFQTAMIQYDDFHLEFVGARSESYLAHSRKPIVVAADLQADLMRRDFTINTLAYSVNSDTFGEITDPFSGKDDIGKKIIRTPLDPEITFKDDPLRILRAIRFATRLQFTIETKTFKALKKMRQRLAIVSQERITEELLQLLKANNPAIGFRLLIDADILEIIFPELAALKGVEQREGFYHKDVLDHTLKVLTNISETTQKLELRLTALLHDIAKPVTKQFIPGIGWGFHGHDEIGARMLKPIFQRLRLPNHMLKYVEKLVRLHLRPIHLSNENVTDSAMRRLSVQAGEDLDDLLILCRADITSGNPDRVKQHLANFDIVAKRLQEVAEKDKLQAFQSPVRGDEIMQLCQLKPGPMVGKLKKMIEEAILEGEIENEHEAAYQYLLKIKDQVVQQ